MNDTFIKTEILKNETEYKFPWMIDRKIFLKRFSNPDESLGCTPDKRPTKDLLEYGIINIDKPAGPTSHQVSAHVRDILKTDKTGHSGTLDPMVTGVLPVAIGKGTRIVNSLLTAGKEYVCLMTLHKDLEESKVRQAIMSFVGEIDQMPPVRSAVKRQWRKRNIYYIEILDIKGREVLYRVGCQAGTYIRKLCTDIGELLKCGAHMSELRRTRAGPFTESTLCTLQDITDAIHYYQEDKNDYYLRKKIQPIESGAAHLPKIWVLDSTVNSLCHGAFLNIPGVSKLESGIVVNEPVAVLTLRGELILVGTSMMTSDDIMKSERGMVVKTDQVFMDADHYPKMTPKKE